ncbi:unnamed protein product [Fraxinus pennsylvanica]|uniref:Late embryogenesis abundant protein LEA-2 subgroup domain-containing protein n=1 Tax=Fraxinus pennsylvanica TaxID=56036 RepID=A0AAD2EBB5_9LAMI|nr:unnamed protein product [Fraxinus pennsylvanica]
MSSSIPQNDDQVEVVQGFPISSNEPYVVYGFPVMAQAQPQFINSIEFNAGRATPSTLESQLESQSHDNITQGLCSDTCLSICNFMVIFLVMGLFIFFLLFTSYARDPIFDVESASVSILNNTSSWKIGILTRNPNKNFEFNYSEFDVRVSCRGEYMFGTKTIAFNSIAKSETLLNATVVVPLANISDFIANPYPDGVVNIDVNLKSSVVVQKASRRPQQTNIKVLCKDVRIKVSEDKRDWRAVVEGPKKCSVKMRTLW